MASVASIKFGAVIGGRVWSGIEKGFQKTLHEHRRELELLLARASHEWNVTFVVLIDELDRIEDGEIRAVAQLVKAVADFPQISYLLTYDRPRVVQALGGAPRRLN